MFFLFISSLLADQVINGIYYKLDETNNEATIVNATCPTSDTTLDLRNEVTVEGKTYTLKRIEENAFKGCEHYTGDLTVPETVTFIGYMAFANCGFTGSLNFNAPVDIDASLFSGSDKWTGSLTIGNKVPSIGARAFENLFLNCQTLTIGTGVTSIGSMAFYNCKFAGSETLTIPSNVKKLGNQFLGSVTGPKHLDLQASVENLTQGDMTGLDAFETLKISNVVRLSEKCLFGHKHFKTITITNCQYYEAFAFANTSFNQDLVIPQSVKAIKCGCFAHSSWTGDLTINAAISEIDFSVFPGATFGGSHLTITNVKSIGPRAFENCFSSSVTLSIESIEILGSMAFYGLKIENIVVPSTTSLIGRAAFCGSSAKELTINGNDKLTKTNYTWFEGSNQIERLNLGSKFDTIGESSFAYSSNFKGGLTFSKQLKAIEDRAFYHCSGFSGSFHIPETVQSIGENSFSFCTGFTDDLIIDANVAVIDQTMFSESGFKGSLVIGSHVTTISIRAFELLAFKGNLTIGQNVETIGSLAFYGNEFTGSLIIPSKVTQINSQAFMNCKSIDNIKILSSNINVSLKAFSGMPALKSVTYCGYDDMSSFENIFDDTIKSINVNNIYLFDTVFGKPKNVVLCSVCNIQYPGHSCIDVDPTSIPSQSPSQSPSKSPSKSPSQSPSKLPPQTPTLPPTELPSESPTPGSIIVVPDGGKLDVTDSKVSDVQLKGDATVSVETNTEVTFSPSEGNHGKTTLTLDKVESPKLTISSFDDVVIKVKSDTPISIVNTKSVTIEGSQPTTIAELRAHPTQRTTTFNAPNSQVTISQVVLEGQDKAISFEGNSLVKDVKSTLNSKASLNNAEINGKIDLETNSELSLNSCKFRASRVDLHFNNFQSKTKLKINKARSMTLSDNFDPKEINVYFNDDKATGETTIIEGIDEGTCTDSLSKVKLPNSRFSASCSGSNIVVKAADGGGDKDDGNNNKEEPKSQLLLYVIIAAVAVVVILAVVIVVIVIMKKKKDGDKNERSLSENMGSSLQSPLLF